MPATAAQPARRTAKRGPTLKARERLEDEGRWAELRDELHALAERHNEADASLLMQAEYLVTIGRKG
jgi:hypothetical protein